MIAELFYDSFGFSIVCGFLVVFLIKPYKKYHERKQKDHIRIEFKDLLYSLSASIASGRQLVDGIKESLFTLETIYGKESWLYIELNRLVIAVKENHADEISMLKELAIKSDCDEILSFVEVYSTSRSSGGNLNRIIASTERILSEKINIEREIKTLTAQKRFEGQIITAIPIIVIVMLRIMSPDYLDVMYTTLTGRLLMTIALAGIVFASWLSMKITAIEV